jgi:hypothetical protein
MSPLLRLVAMVNGANADVVALEVSEGLIIQIYMKNKLI